VKGIFDFYTPARPRRLPRLGRAPLDKLFALEGRVVSISKLCNLARRMDVGVTLNFTSSALAVPIAARSGDPSTTRTAATGGNRGAALSCSSRVSTTTVLTAAQSEVASAPNDKTLLQGMRRPSSARDDTGGCWGVGILRSQAERARREAEGNVWA